MVFSNLSRICTTAGVLEAYSGPRKQLKRNIPPPFAEAGGVLPGESFSSQVASIGEENLTGSYLLEPAIFAKNFSNELPLSPNTLEDFEDFNPADSLVPEYSSGDDDVCRLFLRDESSSPQNCSEVSSAPGSTPDFRKLAIFSTPLSIESVSSEEQTVISDVSESFKDLQTPKPGTLLGNKKERTTEEEEETTITTTSSSSSSNSKETKTEKRRAALERFRQKRANRCFQKKIRYECRKRLADVRPRIRGRFVKKEDFQTLCLETGDATVPTVY